MTSNKVVREQTNPLLGGVVAACGRAFAVVAVFSMCINVLMLTAPLYMLQVFDRVLSSRSTDTLLMLMLIAGLALLTMAALEAVRAFALIRISGWLDGQLAGQVLSGSVAAALRSSKGPSIQGLRDLTTVRMFLSGQSIFPIMDAPWTPIFIVVIFLMHPYLGWLSVVGAVLLFAFALANEIATRNLLMLSGGASIAAFNQAESAARNADVIEAMGMMPGLIRRWSRKNLESLDLQARASARSGTITAVSRLLRMGLQIGILSLGAWLVILGETTAGAMIAASILMGRALAPVEQAIGTWKLMIAARNAYERVKKQLDETMPTAPAMPLPAPKGAVRVEGVAFKYPGATESLLRNLSFQVAAGEAVGLIGPTAVGKTTLARLLVGNLAPSVGHVRLDGMDVAEWEATDLGPHVGYLPQDVELFAGTVKDNIARMQDADPDAVVAAARLAGVHDMVLGMAKGYDTEIGEGGAALSGGQRQRIALARAVFGEPKFLVFDEPNASLDADGEVALVDAIRTLKQRRATVVVIAHRPSILQDVDKILMLRSGTVEMFGARDEVIAKLKGGDTERPAARIARPAPPVIEARPVIKSVPPKPKMATVANPSRQPSRDATANRSHMASSSRPMIGTNLTFRGTYLPAKSAPNRPGETAVAAPLQNPATMAATESKAAAVAAISPVAKAADKSGDPPGKQAANPKKARAKVRKSAATTRNKTRASKKRKARSR